MKGITLRKSAFYATLALTFGLAVPAGAQTAAPEAAPADSAADVEEIVVTARRVEERAQDVPISMTVFNQNQLNAHNITDGVSLAAYTPSLSTNSEFGTEGTSFAMRGFRQEIDTTASVAVYFADVVSPRGGSAGTNTGDGAGPGAFFDLQNVQVLKGPQGTLFGRNTDGGAILLVPQKPTGLFEGTVDATAGSHGMYRTQGILNVPVDDKLRLRFGIDHESRDGYLNVINSDGGPSHLSDINYTAARASAVWDILPNVENYTVGSISVSDHYGVGQKEFACNSASELGALLACPQFAVDSKGGFWDVENDTPFAKSRAEQWQFINTTSWTANDNLIVKNIASYAHLTNTIYNDLFGTNWKMPAQLYDAQFNAFVPDPFAGAPISFTNVITAPGHKDNDMADMTEELQFQGHELDSRLVWQAGAYAEFNEPQARTGVTSGTTISCTNILDLQCTDVLGALGNAEGFAGTVNYQVGRIRYHDYGIYEQSSYNLTDKLKLTEGLRYTLDSAEAHYDEGYYHFFQPNQPALFCDYTTSPYNFGVEVTQLLAGQRAALAPAPGPDACSVSLKKNSEAPTWILGLDYKVIDSMLVYGKYARGYRQGSVSPTGPEGVSTFNPEKVESFEVGTKNSLDRFVRGTFNVALFYNNFRDQQISEGFECPATNPECGAAPNIGIVNAGHSHTYGAEIESTLSLFKGMTLAFSYAYIESALVSINKVALPAGSPYGNPTDTVTPGSAIPLTPQNKVSTTATYVLPLASHLGRVSTAVNYTYQSSEIQSGYTATPYYKTGGYGLTNLNLDWNGIYGSRFDAGMFATNVFDQRYYTFVTGVYNSVGAEFGQVGEPRMFGGHVRVNFGG
jgi:iron complex outermembrane receptor protein